MGVVARGALSATSTTTLKMNQTDFARWAQHQYDELGLRPTLEPGSDYEGAHSPLPRGMGNETIPLHSLDHVIHDIFQSEAVGSRHFTGHARAALYGTPSYWPPGWLDACDIYEKFITAPLSLETRQKISEGLKGHEVSEETRQKISEAHKGKTLSEDHRSKISEKSKLLRHSDESKKKISESNKGRELSEETKQKISETTKGRRFSDESRQKMSDAKSGRVLSEETKRKMSEAAKRRWARTNSPEG